MATLGTLIAAALLAAGDAGAVVGPNWAGYVATPAAGAPAAFTSVSGTWRQPRPVCTTAEAGAAAVIWVGLGGYDASSHALEQIGSAVGCDRNGKPTSSAWFDLFPYPAHTIPLKAGPGDAFTATVTVLATAVQLRLVNRTRRWTFQRTIAVPADTTSAEWIVEAPLTCVLHTCRQTQLAKFGSLTFTQLSAGTDRSAQALTTPAWTVTPVELASGAAAPGPMADDGTAFTVIWIR